MDIKGIMLCDKTQSQRKTIEMENRLVVNYGSGYLNLHE